MTHVRPQAQAAIGAVVLFVASCTPGPHHHPESCWIDDTNPDDADVDMMLFVVGLNHRMRETCPSEGDCALNEFAHDKEIGELADAIYAAWPNPENVVVVASAFSMDCNPGNGACLQEALTSRYGQPFQLGEIGSDPGRWSTMGLIAGSRWSIQSTTQLDLVPGQQSARIELHDTATGLRTWAYALHTKNNDDALPELRAAAAFNPKSATSGGKWVAPILAGDFNLPTPPLRDPATWSPDATKFLRRHLNWTNDSVRCESVSGLQGGVFETQKGHKMHAVTGRIVGPDPKYAYSCASAEFQTVRLTYSVDVNGRLALRRDGAGAAMNGIILDNISHNVIAVGLRIRERDGAVPVECLPPSDTHACEDACDKAFDNCLRGCESSSIPNCIHGCQQIHGTCLARCH
jgi:hypothetical protein